ncbi:MAG: 4a-hydroxytetrahydrobiopterin dehydratase [Marmoricola sp.]
MSDETPQGWERSGDALHRTFETKDFASALDLVNRIGALAEEANHHPDLELGWGKVVVHLTTHSAGHVTDNDRGLAAQINDL